VVDSDGEKWLVGWSDQPPSIIALLKREESIGVNLSCIQYATPNGSEWSGGYF